MTIANTGIDGPPFNPDSATSGGKTGAVVLSAYAEAFFYTATGAGATSLAIDTASLYHGIVLTTTGTRLSGWTHKAGQANAIASVADNSGVVAGTILVTTTGAHNLAVGDIVTHTGFTTRTAYRGKYVVLTTPLSTTYTVAKAYSTSTDTGFMKRAFSLKAGTGAAGIYRASYSLTLAAASDTTDIKIEVNNGTSEADNIAAEHSFQKSGDLSVIGTSGVMTIAEGDTIWLSIANTTDSTDVTIRHASLSLSRIG